MQISSNKNFKKQYNKNIPQFLKKGVVVTYYDGNQTADIYFVDNPQTIVRRVIVGNEAAGELSFLNEIAGQPPRCVVSVFDESNPKDMIIIATY